MEGENAVRVAQRLLMNFGGVSGLHRVPFEEVFGQYGIGQAKVAQINAAFGLGNRLLIESPKERPAIHSPADAVALVQFSISALEQEELRVILLETRNRVLHIEAVYRGG